MSTFVPGCWAWKSVPYCLTTLWIFGEPGSMIHTWIEPLSLPEALAAFVEDDLSPPPHAATTAASTNAATATLNFLIRPPLHRAGGMIGVSSVRTGRHMTHLAGRLWAAGVLSMSGSGPGAAP